jgi:hypothetical protein
MKDKMNIDEFRKRLRDGSLSVDGSGHLSGSKGSPRMESAISGQETPLKAINTLSGAPGIQLIFNNMPKVSLNQWYSGQHWKKRKEIKDIYAKFIASVHPEKYTKRCDTTYIFEWKTRSLDPSNCMAMIKLIEDSLFPDDSYKIIRWLNIHCRRVAKGVKHDRIIISINPV